MATVYGTTLRSAPCSAHAGIGIAQVLADDAVEGLPVVRAVEVAEHVVEGTVLEQHHHDVIERMGLVESSASDLGPRARRVCGAPEPAPRHTSSHHIQ